MGEDRTEKKKTAFLGGSYTVEAAFLVPVILGIFFAWLFQLFYLHDRVIINGMLKEAALEREEQFYGGDGEEALEGDASDGDVERRKEMQSHLWLMEIQSFQWKEQIAGGTYHLRSRMAWNIPVMKRFLEPHAEYSVHEEAEKRRPEDFVRMKGKEE